MTDLFHRSFPDLEIRSDVTGRTIHGIAVPYDKPAEIRDERRSFVEVFRRGSFARTIAERGPQRVKALANHQYRVLPIGRASMLREDAAGLYAELKISRTEQGDEVLELVRDGALDALSIGFMSVKGGDRWNDRQNSVERVEVRLNEISVVAFPAYADALIGGVRMCDTPSTSVSTAEARLRLLRL